LITLDQANSLANQGVATSTTETFGGSTKATKAQVAAGTDLGILNPLYIPAEYATSTGGLATTSIPVTGVDGTLDQGFWDLTEDYSFSGTNSFSSTTSFTSTTTFTGFVSGAIDDWFGDGSDGDATISSNTTLSSDKLYRNLTINDGFTFNPGGFRIYVKEILTFVGTGKIACNGGAGGDGGDASLSEGGTAGSAGAIAYATANTVLPIPLVGKIGGLGVSVNDDQSAGNPGTAGDNNVKAININASGDGGNGGIANGQNGGVGGANGTITNINKGIKIVYDSISFVDDADNSISILYPNTGSGSGGSGGAWAQGTGDDASSGGGGGSGASGGIVLVSAKSVITVNGNSYLEAIGGDGGDGGDGWTEPAHFGAGGGGGAGGAGGIVILIYTTKTGTGTESSSGGALGAGGIGDNADDGVDGGGGGDGETHLFQI